MATLEQAVRQEPRRAQKTPAELLIELPRPASVNVTVLGGSVSIALNGNPPQGFSVKGSEIRVQPGSYAVTLLLQNVDFGPAGYVVYPALEPGLGAGSEKAAVAYIPSTGRAVVFTILNNLEKGEAELKARTDLDTFDPVSNNRIRFHDPTIVYEPPGG